MGSKKRTAKKKIVGTKILDDEDWKQRVPKVPEKKNHYPFEQWMVDALVLALENMQALSDWEKDFVKDRAGAFDKFGFNAVITDKQIESLKSLNGKLKVRTLLKGLQ